MACMFGEMIDRVRRQSAILLTSALCLILTKALFAIPNCKFAILNGTTLAD